MQPDPLPRELPVGTKIIENGVIYTAASIGKLIVGSSNSYYDFNDLISDLGAPMGGSSFLPNQIIWTPLPIEDNKVLEDLVPNKCKWCNKELDPIETLCFPEDSLCSFYWVALIQRMHLDFRKPEEALAYDRECVKNFVDNSRKKK